MPRTKISEFSTTAGNNTDIDGINIAEGCAPSGINDAIRELMAQLKDFQAGTAGDSFNGPIGSTTPAAGAFTNLSASGTFALTGDQVQISEGGTGQTTANAAFNALAPSQTSQAGKYLKTDGTNTSWDAIDINTADITGTLPIANGGTGLTALGTGVQTALGQNVTGSGGIVLATSPTLVTPALGTPSSVTLTNATGLPLSTGVTGTLATTNGGTGLTSFTANGVVYASSSSALTTGSALTFNGTSLGVGIGAAASEGQLHLNNASGADLVLTRTNGATSGLLGRIRFGNTDVDSAMSEISSEQSGATNASNLIFSTQASGGAASEQMRLTSTGLGIGTSSPSFKLDVSGANAQSIRVTSSNGDLANLVMNSTGNASWSLSSDTVMRFKKDSTEYMRLDSSGNLGIGTSSPAYKLDVQGSATDFVAFSGLNTNNNAGLATSSAIKFGFTSTVGTHYATLKITEDAGNDNSGSLTISLPFGGVESTKLTLNSSGNLSIGTTTAIGRATVVGGTSQLAFHDGNGSTTNYGLLNYGGSSGELTLNANSNGGNTLIRFLTSNGGSNAERARITSGGNLLVGTTTDPGGSGKICDANGNVRAIPQSGSAKTTSYTLATTDVGEYIQVGSGGSVTIPDATFATGDVVSVFNNTTGNITITCSITTAYIAGTDSDKATMTLATRGVATILFISGTVCVVTGNVT